MPQGVRARIITRDAGIVVKDSAFKTRNTAAGCPVAVRHIKLSVSYHGPVWRRRATAVRGTESTAPGGSQRSATVFS